ncbi:MAG TPA: Glu/Leu/Phe/Val dehydrogenase [Methylocella sp.]|nr:Glu/Leu/Phe/Val dehydrogenase [Methylocella sp.]
MEDMFGFADRFGPAKIVHIHRPSLNLKAIVVIDNIACGSALGGVRMAPDVSALECFRLARAMTWKNAAAGLAHGGGKAVIFGDPHMPVDHKQQVIRAFADAIGDLTDYVPGPDMGTDELCMGWVEDEIGRAAGLPAAIGGIPINEIGATGFGLAACVDVAGTFIGLELKGARVAVQGFGAVGRHAARFLAEKGAVLVAASDRSGTLVDHGGLDIAALIAFKDKGYSLHDYPHGKKLEGEAILDVECDIWIPAARPDIVHTGNVARLRARLIPQGANIPCTQEAEVALHKRGILTIPDIIANAGGVICAAIEYQGGTQATAFEHIDERIRTNTRLIIEESQKSGEIPRRAALALAERRLQAAMRTRRWP